MAPAPAASSTLAPPSSDSPAAGSAAASASSSPLSSLLKLPAWGPSSRAASPGTRAAAELPHSRYIPESERGWHGTASSAASGASNGGSTASRDRRRSSTSSQRSSAAAVLCVPSPRKAYLAGPAAAGGERARHYAKFLL